MAFDPTLSTTRDRVRVTLGDIADPPGFGHLSPIGAPLVPQLSETLYDSLIAQMGPREAAVAILNMVIQALPTKYNDGNTSEDLSKQIENLESLKGDIRAGVTPIDGGGRVVAARLPISHPDVSTYSKL